MWVKFLCVAALVGMACGGFVAHYRGLGKGRGHEYPSLYPEKEFPSTLYELPCMKLGGLCIQKNECPKGKDAGKEGLCPLQQDQGVECCFSGPISSICRLNGGECIDASTNCPSNLKVSTATDCSENEQCCVMVH